MGLHAIGATVLWLGFAGLLVPGASAFAESGPDAVGTLTLLDGTMSLLRATARYTASEGLRLQPGDVVETGDKAFAQIEFTAGGLVALGPRSRLLLLRFPAAAAATPRQLFLLEGWIKVAALQGKQPAALECLTPLLSVSATKAIAVVRASDRSGEVFAESATVRIADLSREGRAESYREVKEGEFYTRAADRSRGAVMPRPAQAFVAAVPREFRDDLVPRPGALKRGNVAGKREADFQYAEVKAWLDSLPAVRALLADRWRDKLGDPAFREAVAANLKDHPEWERALHAARDSDARASRKTP